MTKGIENAKQTSFVMEKSWRKKKCISELKTNSLYARVRKCITGNIILEIEHINKMIDKIKQN